MKKRHIYYWDSASTEASRLRPYNVLSRRQASYEDLVSVNDFTVFHDALEHLRQAKFPSKTGVSYLIIDDVFVKAM